ncbi:MAG: YihA family ribosome biogenesis GTP-binding protein [Candidatus Syntrophonatronum acetioxidans]|uniref:Probable GTP-binding protein EngB n=1 Tax=Candidatus Syntrophonatronum acetioxidans TaxID=1795816 RepID=A0A424YDU2_9FIRM|nr:MAG: YihA family ribosome biogenesis GTP-binding protein [Candidatus Syntrophonatronum acetioxidans]
MRVKSVEFVKKASQPGQFPPEELPEVAFAGRSNVGKSSLINTLINRKKLAPTSGQPGKTRTIDFYIINGKIYLVDLPGYGFARVSKKMKEKWGKLVEGYLQNRSQLKLVVLLVDIRHDPTEDDLLMYDWLKYYHIPVLIAATKRDKISRGKALQKIKGIKAKLEVEPGDLVVPFSAKSKEGKDEIWKYINQLSNQG